MRLRVLQRLRHRKHPFGKILESDVGGIDVLVVVVRFFQIARGLRAQPELVYDLFLQLPL